MPEALVEDLADAVPVVRVDDAVLRVEPVDDDDRVLQRGRLPEERDAVERVDDAVRLARVERDGPVHNVRLEPERSRDDRGRGPGWYTGT